MDSIRFFVPGKPRGKGRPRFSGGRAYTDEQTRDYERLIGLAFRGSARGFRFPDDQFVSVAITQQMPIPQSASKAKRAEMVAGHLRPSAKPDVDNVIKAVLDALNGVAYKDDARVVDVHARKIYSETPGVLVEIKSCND